MKKVLVIVFMVLTCNASFSQDVMIETVKSSKPIAISDIKTSHFIFKSKIKYLDIGSKYFVTDTIENIVKVKHVGNGYTEKNEEKSSNLTVITQSGDFYTIPIYFKRDLVNTTYKFGYPQRNLSSVVAEEDNTPLFEMCHFSKTAPSNVDIKGNRDLILAKITGIFYRENHLSIRLEVKNFSTIDLDIDHFLFRFIKNKRFAKDATYQERVLRPSKICNDTQRIKGTGGIEIFNFVFEKFTPNVDEDLILEIIEQAGGRSTTIEIPRKKLLKPKVI